MLGRITGWAMNQFSNRIAAGAIAALVVAAGCAPATDVTKLYHDPDAGASPYRRILVVGIAAQADQRRWMEDLLTARLAARDVAAVPAYTRLGFSPVLLQDDIDAAAAATGSDAILVTHLVSASEEVEVVEGRTDVSVQCRGGNPLEYFLYDYEEIREPDSVSIAREVIIVTNLYDVRSETRVWTIQSTCFEKSAFEAILDDEARAIVEQLRRDRLIPTGST